MQGRGLCRHRHCLRTPLARRNAQKPRRFRPPDRNLRGWSGPTPGVTDYQGKVCRTAQFRPKPRGMRNTIPHRLLFTTTAARRVVAIVKCRDLLGIYYAAISLRSVQGYHLASIWSKLGGSTNFPLIIGYARPPATPSPQVSVRRPEAARFPSVSPSEGGSQTVAMSTKPPALHHEIAPHSFAHFVG